MIVVQHAHHSHSLCGSSAGSQWSCSNVMVKERNEARECCTSTPKLPRVGPEEAIANYQLRPQRSCRQGPERGRDFRHFTHLTSATPATRPADGRPGSTAPPSRQVPTNLRANRDCAQASATRRPAHNAGYSDHSGTAAAWTGQQCRDAEAPGPWARSVT